jgi:hypothetical protein
MYLIWIQFKTVETLSKEMLNSLLAILLEVESSVQQAWQQLADTSDQYSEIHLPIRRRYVARFRARNGHIVLFCDISIEGSVQSIGLHWALLSNISMWFITITNWNLYHLLCTKALNYVCLYSFNPKIYWVNTYNFGSV